MAGDTIYVIGVGLFVLAALSVLLGSVGLWFFINRRERGPEGK